VRSSIPCDTDMFELCCEVMADENLEPPTTFDEAVNVYLLLRNKVLAAC